MKTLPNSHCEEIIHAGIISRTIVDLDGPSAFLTQPRPSTAESEPHKVPTYAQMARAFAHAPIFFSFPKGKRSASTLDVTYVADDKAKTTYVFKGPELLGPSDLWVFQSLVGIAGVQRAKIDVNAMLSTGRMRSFMLNVKLTHASDSCKKCDELRFIGIRLDLAYLARTLGYSRANRRTRLQLLQSIHRLAAINVEVQRLGCKASFQLLAVDPMDSEELIVVLNPISSEAVLQTKGYLRIQLDDRMELKSDAARLLHSRLSWINQGGKEGRISFELLCKYIYGDSVVSLSAISSRRSATYKAILELRDELGWTVRQKGNIYYFSRPEKPRKAAASS